MTARDDILARVRAARGTAGAGQRPGGRSGVWSGVPTAEPCPGSADQFVTRVTDHGATVDRCPATGVERAIAAALTGRTFVVPPGLPWHLPGAVLDRGQPPAELDRIQAVVTTAAVAVAETGTVVLSHGPGQGRRALSLVPDLHVCVVRADQVVAGVGDAVAALDPRSPQTWISGPSATSDIELSRVEGVHGPRVLHIVLAET